MVESDMRDFKDLTYSDLSRLVFLELLESDLLSASEKGDIRQTLGIGVSNFSGNYQDLTNKPIIPKVPNIDLADTTSTVGTVTSDGVVLNTGIYLLKVPAVGSSSEKSEWEKTEEFRNSDLQKLQGIQPRAKHNVNPDWNQTDPRQDSFIQNKPRASDLFSNVVRDWAETDSNSLAYIRNKPTSSQIADKVFNNIPTNLTALQKNQVKSELDLTDADVGRQSLLNIPATFTESQKTNFRNTLRIGSFQTLVALPQEAFNVSYNSTFRAFRGIISPIFQIYRGVLYLQYRTYDEIAAFWNLQQGAQGVYVQDILDITGFKLELDRSPRHRNRWYIHQDRIYKMQQSRSDMYFTVYDAYFHRGVRREPVGGGDLLPNNLVTMEPSLVNGRQIFYESRNDLSFLVRGKIFDSFYIDGSDIVAVDSYRSTGNNELQAPEKLYRFPIGSSPTDANLVYDVKESYQHSNYNSPFHIGIRELGNSGIYAVLTQGSLRLRDSDGNLLMEPIDFYASNARAAGGIAIDNSSKRLYIQVLTKSTDDLSMTCFPYYFGDLIST